MSEPKRVLNVTLVLAAAGIESFIMNMYRNIDREKVQFDFMVMRDEPEFYDKEIKSLGGKKFTISVKANNTLLRAIKESRELYKFLKKNPYEIVHIHYTTPLRCFYLQAAKKAGVPVRIYHSHSAEVSGKSKIKLLIYDKCRKNIAKWGNYFWACSKAAARWMYSGKVLEQSKVIYNGIDIDKFRFDKAARNELRKELGLDGKYVIVHTGRFLDQKNHSFIIKVFERIKEKMPESKLLLLGTGELENEIKQQVKDASLTDDVMFLGVRSDVNRVLSAADCYIMPSLYEGLPVAAVEAQCAGLPCVFSKNITDEIRLTDNTKFLDLNEPIDNWCDAVLSFKDTKREDTSENVRKSGYDVEDVASGLQRFYLEHPGD